MHRYRFAAVLLVVASGCLIPPEQLPLQPVPQDGTGLTYAEVVLRGRLQAGAADVAGPTAVWRGVSPRTSPGSRCG